MSVLPVNARLTRIDTPGVPDARGGLAYSNGSAISIPCVIDEPTRAQQFKLGANLKDVKAVMYIEHALLAAGTQILEGYRVTGRQEINGTAVESDQTWIVHTRELRVFEEITHYELFLKKA